MGVLFGVLNHSLLGHLGYRKPHLDDLVRLVSMGRLDVSRSVSDVIALDEVHEGVRRLETKEGNPVRIVIDPRR
jgi:threonine dehydrogenase-like Zn-dependent dehydrogenase